MDCVEWRRREICGERDDVAQVLRRLDDVDPLVVGHRHEASLDEVGACPLHRRAVGLQSVRERLGMIRLDAGDDLQLVGVGVDLAGSRLPRRALLGELAVTELQDGVGIEAVERAQVDHPIVALAADRPVIGARGECALEPGGVQVDCDSRRAGGALESTLLGRAEHAPAGGDHLVVERGQLPGRLDLDPLPEPDLRLARLRPGLVEVARDGLEATGDRVEAFGEWRVVAHEQQEQPVADGVERERPALPDPQLLRLEQRAAQVVELDVALEADGARQPGGVQRLDRGEVRAVGGDLGQDRLAAAIPQLVVVVVDAEIRGGDRVVAHQPPEPLLDELVEPIVERATIGGRRRPRQHGTGQSVERVKRDAPGDVHGRRGGPSACSGQAVAATRSAGSSTAVIGVVSARASRVAWMTVSMSAAETS